MDIITPSENEILEALNRSGYLLESRISKLLSNSGFSIQTNQVIKDPLTQKNREIDLIAERNNYEDSMHLNRCYTQIRFVFEIKNTSAPIVLLTNFEYHPNLKYFEGLKEWLTMPKNVDYDQHILYYPKLINETRKNVFTQYCSFQKKKGNDELMALHPENLYEGLSKITQYCEERVERRILNDDFLRHVLYLPVLLIRDDLFELHHYEDETVKLNRVSQSTLVYNYYTKDEETMAFVFIVTEKGFPDFINSMLKIEQDVLKEMIEKRKKAESTAYNPNPINLV